MLNWGFQLSSDFTGGSIWEIQFDKPIAIEKINDVFTSVDIPLTSLNQDSQKYNLKFKNINTNQKENN
jgi:preprotein translocase subunit SecF